MALFFRKIKHLEVQIDGFLNLVRESALLFERALHFYLKKEMSEFESRLKSVSENEHTADKLRIEIERNLYINTLIPDSRGDVLGILENTDNIIDKMKETLNHFSIEKPVIDDRFTDMFEEVSQASLQSVDVLISSIKAFFRDFNSVNDHIHKVHFFEKEADQAAEKLKREIYATDMSLCEKSQISRFVTNVEKVSDYAYEVSGRLAIYTIKRQI